MSKIKFLLVVFCLVGCLGTAYAQDGPATSPTGQTDV